MKYKIKFELDYSNMSKQEARDSKIDELLNKDELMEIEVDPQFKLPLPKVGEMVDIKGKQYGVIGSKTRIDDMSYTVVYLVESHEKRKEVNDSGSAKHAQMNQAHLKKLMNQAHLKKLINSYRSL